MKPLDKLTPNDISLIESALRTLADQIHKRNIELENSKTYDEDKNWMKGLVFTNNLYLKQIYDILEYDKILKD